MKNFIHSRYRMRLRGVSEGGQSVLEGPQPTNWRRWRMQSSSSLSLSVGDARADFYCPHSFFAKIRVPQEFLYLSILLGHALKCFLSPVVVAPQYSIRATYYRVFWSIYSSSR